MTVFDLKREGSLQLAQAGLPEIEARLFLEALYEISLTQLIAKYQDEALDEEINKYRTWINERCEGRPLQHIIGYQYFKGLKFRVNSHVLIPRPETEALVDQVIVAIESILKFQPNSLEQPLRIADVCTGSGCIIIALADYLKAKGIYACLYGTDLSTEALRMAQLNESEILGQPMIKWCQGDLLEAIDTEAEFDIIVSNPPYIKKEDIKTLEKEVRDYDPMMALDGGIDGLDFYRRLVEGGKTMLKSWGSIYFEIGHGQSQAIKELFEKANYRDIVQEKDLAGLERIVYAKGPH